MSCDVFACVVAFAYWSYGVRIVWVRCRTIPLFPSGIVDVLLWFYVAWFWPAFRRVEQRCRR